MKHENFLKENNARHFWHPMAHPAEMLETPPMIISKASGVEVEDIDGHKMLDAVGGLWNVNLGYSCQPIKEAITKQLEKMPYCNTFRGITNDKAIELSFKLKEWFSSDGMERSFFTQGGSDSVDTAMRLVRQYWKVKGESDRVKFIALSKGYHGTHYGGASLCGDARFRRNYEPGIPGIYHIPAPYTFRNPFNEMDSEKLAIKCCQRLEELIASQGADTIAAFILEPVIGSGGVIVPHKSFMKNIREICNKHRILLIADEVICAFGRTGHWTGSRLWGVKPDIMTIAKALTGGYFPMGATLLSGEIAEAIEENKDNFGILGHGYTNSGNPVGAAAALAALQETEKLDVVSNAKARGSELLLGLNQLKEKYEMIGDVRGQGLMAAIEMVDDRKTRKPSNKDRVSSVFNSICKAGVLIRASGNNFIISPSLVINSKDVTKIVSAIDNGFKENN
tara:strand:- start:5491 stop:6843 length:1353 start_codon:yes stop_codon:yes gene_type:complete